jgi:flagellin-like hook-associated protein FlgL
VISATGSNGALEQSYRRHSAQGAQALERLSTGKRINRPKDDPAGFVAAETIRSEIVSLRAELKVVGRQRAATRQEQSSLTHMQNQLLELQGVVAGAADGLLTAEQRELYQQEINIALQAIDRINQQRMNRAAKSGGTPSPVGDVTAPLEGAADVGQLQVAARAQSDTVNLSRAALAAYEKYELNVRQHVAEDALVHHAEALSQIEDADFAEEASNLAAAQVLTESTLQAMRITRELNAEHIEALLEGVDEVVE